MKFWKTHQTLRMGLMGLLFLAGLALVVGGWRETGKLMGVAVMLVGVWGLLTALINAHRPVGQPPLRESAALALRMHPPLRYALAALALAGLLFSVPAALQYTDDGAIWNQPPQTALLRMLKCASVPRPQ